MHSYLSDTLSSLMSELSPAEKNDCVIVVLIAEVSGSPPPHSRHDDPPLLHPDRK